MKIILVIVLILVSNLAYSQIEWAPIGAKWYISKMEGTMPPNEGYILYEVKKDTLIQDQKVRMISKTYFHSNGKDVSASENEYTYEKDSVVYYWKNGHFYTLYDFGAHPGDKWTVYGSGMYKDFCKYDSLGTVVVDSICSLTISNKKLKAIYTSPYKNSDWSYKGVILEKIGNISHLLPKAKECGVDIPDSEGQLRCYEDNIIGVYKSSYCKSFDCKCNDLKYYTSVNTLDHSSFQVYPNPAKDYLEIKCLTNNVLNGNVIAEIYSLKGEIVGAFRNPDKLFVGSLNKGFYILKLLLSDQILYFKFIKE